MARKQQLLKVLNPDFTSPFQDFPYEIGREYVCEEFDPNPAQECSRGFYATAIEGLPYSWNIRRVVVMVEVDGRHVEIDQYKRRYERMTVLRQVRPDEIKELAAEAEQTCGYRLAEVLFPVNPFTLHPPEINQYKCRLVRQWATIGASVRASVGASIAASFGASVAAAVWASVGASVRESVRASVRASVWASVWAYIGSLFPQITTWTYMDPPPGDYPFQAGVDLWRQGLVPSFDGTTWRLHGGPAGQVLYTYEEDAFGKKPIDA